MDLVNHLEGRLLFAVPKKGRLLQATLNLLAGADIQFRRENRLDIALVKNHPIALVFLPAADIPTFVGEGQVDIGITGWDQVQEHDAGIRSNESSPMPVAGMRRKASKADDGSTLSNGTSETSADRQADTTSAKLRGCETVMDLAFGACKLQVQVPVEGTYKTPRDLIGKNIGTSFVRLTEDYFAKLEAEADGGADAPSSRRLRTNIIELSGSVEAACALGVADGIVDLVESGETMKAAGLMPIDTVVESTAILIKSKSPAHPEMVSLIAERIRGVITAQRYVLCQYNVARAKLPEATKITPGKRAPTITSLEEDGWVAVSAMVEKKAIANTMDDLTRVGATDILVLDIHNSRG